jgi:hypothetical protein
VIAAIAMIGNKPTDRLFYLLASPPILISSVFQAFAYLWFPICGSQSAFIGVNPR